ncbi:MAG: serine hydroxymethyltransferase [Nanoarchaeota archaeon]|nr:serine hydroxymethyltransferase [Nanoarchaeota archaeon]
MTEIIVIVAVAQNGVIGKDNDIPWRISEDFQYFKEQTLGCPCIMGDKTYESLPIKPLPGRENIVCTFNKEYKPEGTTVFHDFFEAVQYVKDKGYPKAFITGGATIYKLGMQVADKFMLTRIHQDYQGDISYPEVNFNEWNLIKQEDHESIDTLSNQPVKFSFLTYTRKNKRLQQTDPLVASIIKKEATKQQHKLSLIPSENFYSSSVREAVGSVFMHKYAEGNIGKRYYEGNQFADQLESLAIARAKKAFNLPEDWSVNVQALAGSNANLAVYLTLLEVGDTIMGMYLPDGGHLSHGWSYEPKTVQDPQQLIYLGGSRKVNISSRIFRTVQYKTNPLTQQFDYDEIERIALQHQPKLIITGGTAYPREIDYVRMKEIAQKVGAYYMADIAHEAGFIAAGVNKSPVGIADVITLTTHKTLRSARGALIIGPQELIKKIDRSILPGLQGGPFMHSIAGICVGLGEVLQPEFKEYASQVIKNAQFLCSELQKFDFKIVSGGTDKHLILIDLTNKPILGKKFARALDYAGIIANMNTMPQEKRSPADPSALRLGTPWITTRGMQETEMTLIAQWINQAMNLCSQWQDLDFAEFENQVAASTEIKQIAAEVKELCLRYPLEI